MRWLEARRQRAERLRAVTDDVERARAVFGRLLLIRSVARIRGARADWTYLPVASFLVRCPYRRRIAVLSTKDRAIARHFDLEPHLDPDRDLTGVQEALARVVDAFTGASVSFTVVELYKDPDLPVDEQATRRRHDDLARYERQLGDSIRALPADLPELTSQFLAGALDRTAARMGHRAPGYSPYATAVHPDADRWPRWLAAELVQHGRTTEPTRPTRRGG